jgi:hypothetical protein
VAEWLDTDALCNTMAPTPLVLSDAETSVFLAPGMRWPITNVDIAKMSVNSGDTMLYEFHGNAYYGMSVGFRQYDALLPVPGFIGKFRRLMPYAAVSDTLDQAKYDKHRGLSVFAQNPELFLPENELFATDVYDIVTDKQMKAGEKVMMLELPRFAQLLGTTFKHRSIDKGMQLAKLGRLDFSEWYYCHKAIKLVNGKHEFTANPALQNSTLRFSGSLLPSTYSVSPTLLNILRDTELLVTAFAMQDFMRWNVTIIKFMASFHHPWSDTHRQRAYDMLVRQEVTVQRQDGETFSYERQVVQQSPGAVKAYSMNIPGEKCSLLCVYVGITTTTLAACCSGNRKGDPGERSGDALSHDGAPLEVESWCREAGQSCSYERPARIR